MNNDLNIHIFASMVVTVLLGITIFFSLSQGTQVGGKSPIILDTKIIPALQNLSKNIPNYQWIVTASFTPIVMYFTGHDTVTPYTVTSYKSFLNYIDNKNHSYLLVFENRSELPVLSPSFKKGNLPILAKDFQEIAEYKTDFNRIHLYKRAR